MLRKIFGDYSAGGLLQDLLDAAAQESVPTPTYDPKRDRRAAAKAAALAAPEDYSPQDEGEDRKTRVRRKGAPNFPVKATGEMKERKRAKLSGKYPLQSVLDPGGYFYNLASGDVPFNENVGATLTDILSSMGADNYTAGDFGRRLSNEIIPWSPILGNIHFGTNAVRDVRQGRYVRGAWDAAQAMIGPDALAVAKAPLDMAEHAIERGLGRYEGTTMDPLVAKAIDVFSRDPRGGLMEVLKQEAKAYVKHPHIPHILAFLKAHHQLTPQIVQALHQHGPQYLVNRGVFGEETTNRLRELGYLPPEEEGDQEEQ